MEKHQNTSKEEQKAPYIALLYYKFVHIENPEEFARKHLAFCQSLCLHGRIIIAHEGINGTVSGTPEQTEQYKAALKTDPRFADIIFKEDEVEGHVFKAMHVRHKPEIVTFRVEHNIDPVRKSGERLSPARFYEELQREDVVVLDGRTGYEHDVGHFQGAIRPEVESFKEFPEWLSKNRHLFEGKRVLTYCTGGIRCEKLTAYMLEEGLGDVAQLEGGIVTYGKDPEVRGKLWRGKCFVFDERMAVPINQEENIVIGECKHCAAPTDNYVNCANIDCHTKHFQCPDCIEKTGRSCTPACQEAPRHEVFGTKRGKAA